MKVRGERECKECGTRWSYYETGDVECPSCGSMRSVGIGDRKHHTDAGGDLDLSAAREAAADEPTRRAATKAEDACRHYVQSRGFVSGGELLALDDVYVAAQELKHAAGIVEGRLSVDDDVERFFLSLLRGAEDGTRPPADAVPRAVRAARGLGAAAAVHAYLLDLREYVDDPDTDTPEDALACIERLRGHEKRVQALDGDVDPTTADTLLDAAGALGEYLREGSDESRATVDRLLSALSET